MLLRFYVGLLHGVSVVGVIMYVIVSAIIAFVVVVVAVVVVVVVAVACHCHCLYRCR